MPLSKHDAFARIESVGIVAVIRARSKDQLIPIAEALLAGGVEAIEVTMTTPQAIEGIALLAKQFGEKAVVGVGTVLDAGTAASAIYAGAQFVLSPGFDADTVATTLRHGKIAVPGAFTPTEILRAWSAGVDAVKIFPSTALGPGYFKDVLAPLPQVKLTPTGGVTLENAGEWVKAGAAFLGVGSSLVAKSDLEKSDWDAVTKKARGFVDAVRVARGVKK